MELSRYEEADDRSYDTVKLFLEKFEHEIRPIRIENE